MKLSMMDKDVVQKAAHMLGSYDKVRGYFPSNPRDKRDRSRMYEFSFCGHQATEIMRRLLPHLGQRRSAHIIKIICEWSPRLSGKGHCKGCVEWLEQHGDAFP